MRGAPPLLSTSLAYRRVDPLIKLRHTEGSNDGFGRSFGQIAIEFDRILLHEAGRLGPHPPITPYDFLRTQLS